MANNTCATLMRQDYGAYMLAGLHELLADLPGGLIMAEIGCYAGESTRQFIASGKVDRLLAIDPWGGDYDQGDGVWHSPFAWEQVYATFTAWAVLEPKVTILRMASLAAAKLIADGSLDLVYIDGNHSYDSVIADLAAWWPKVRRGGWLAGHDYSSAFPGVLRAVREAGLTVQTFQDTSWRAVVK